MVASIYENLPTDPELAFLKLEEHFRSICEDYVRQDSDNSSIHYADYIAQVIGAIEELGLAEEFSSRVPPIEEVSYATYVNFGKDVRHYCTRLQIRTARRSNGYSIQFDDKAKQKLRHLINQIRETVDKLEIEERKRDALYKRLLALEIEIDRDRTRIEVYGDLVLTAAGIAGDSAKKLEPIKRFIDSIGNIFHEFREAASELKQLPAPAKPKRIEHKPASKENVKLDDEVPF